jgi:Zn finger protein HypA/HybF involved in hydrogenase expression
MAKKRSHHARRYCEECGQPFESQQVDAYLCPQCFRLQRREKIFARKRQQARRQARAIEFGEQQDSSI